MDGCYIPVQIARIKINEDSICLCLKTGGLIINVSYKAGLTVYVKANLI